jgi:hypothetical protein
MPTYVVTRDQQGRLSARISDGLTVAIQILAETDPRRTEKGIQGFAVLDIATDLGPFRVRNIHIKHFPEHSNPYQVHWYKHYLKGGRPSSGDRNAEHQFLDVAGPLDPTTRRKFAEAILSLFHFIREAAKTKGAFATVEHQEA